ncbi:MAG: dephospho-CoA kinase [Bacteroidota bacterium]|jgi:dephospho-CoA kinase
MKVFGLTGGIGSGKSTVAQIMRDHWIPVFDADRACNEILREKLSVSAQEFSQALGIEHLTQPEISRVVFSDPEKRKWLESIIHPILFQMLKGWRRRNNNPSCYAGVFDAPLIFEKGYETKLAGTIVVLAPETERIQRVMARSSLTEVQVRERMAVQVSDEVRRAKATYVIENDSTLEVLKTRTLEAMRVVLRKIVVAKT